MKTVIDNINEIIINKSKFITLIYNINSIESVNKKLDEAKTLYKDATHYCYAYIIDNYIKASDDGEPTGTAGIPILNVLQKQNLNYVLCIVVRYFGGIKLGAGGLVRAYSKACKNALIIKELKKGYLLEISFDYENIKKIDYLLKDCEIIEKQFNNKTNYKVFIEENLYNNIIDTIKSNCEIINIKNKLY